MNSLDTNILIYAVNSGCREHEKAKQIYIKMLEKPTEWILSDQVLFEFYRALQNSKILEFPLDHHQALQQIRFLREEAGVLHCAYETSFWGEFIHGFSSVKHRSSQIFDRVLAVTLLKNGVRTFYTRNKGDFTGFDFKELINPIDAE